MAWIWLPRKVYGGQPGKVWSWLNFVPMGLFKTNEKRAQVCNDRSWLNSFWIGLIIAPFVWMGCSIKAHLNMGVVQAAFILHTDLDFARFLKVELFFFALIMIHCILDRQSRISACVFRKCSI